MKKNIPSLPSARDIASAIAIAFVFTFATAATALFSPEARAQAQQAAGSQITEIVADGTPISILGAKPEKPAPTLFIFAADTKTSLTNSSYIRCGKILQESDGVLCVAIDMPGHGSDVRPKQQGMGAWRVRLSEKENFVRAFTQRASAAIDYLVREGYTDENRIAIIGISRGGFMAFHFMAAEPRIKAVAALSPVTDLAAVSEFAPLKDDKFLQSFAAKTVAPKLGGRPIWITIGNSDKRVGTDPCIEFTRAVVAAAPADAKSTPVNLRVLQSVNHSPPANSHEDAAAWLSEQLKR